MDYCCVCVFSLLCFIFEIKSMSVQMLSLALFVDNSECVSVWYSNGMKLDQVLSHTLLTTFSFKHLHVRYCNLLICPSNPGPLTTGNMTYSQPSLRASTYSTLFAHTHTHTHTHYEPLITGQMSRQRETAGLLSQPWLEPSHLPHCSLRPLEPLQRAKAFSPTQHLLVCMTPAHMPVKSLLH